jgi:protein-arginine kinase activator protein McsA
MNLTPTDRIIRLQALLRDLAAMEEYELCIQIRDMIERLESEIDTPNS